VNSIKLIETMLTLFSNFLVLCGTHCLVIYSDYDVNIDYLNLYCELLILLEDQDVYMHQFDSI